MKNWNFNGSLKENNKRVLTEAEGTVNMISARKDPSVSFNNDNGTLRMTLNIPTGGGSGSGGGETESGVGRTYVTEDGESRGEYFNVYEGEDIGNAIGKFSHAEGGNLFRESSSCLPHTKWVGKTIWIDRTKPEFSNLSSCQIYIESSIASGLNSHAEGFQTAAIGDESHAEGYNTEAHGKISHAEGRATIAKGTYSHAEGEKTTTMGLSSHAEGCDTEAGEAYSHVEGFHTSTQGVAAHAEGDNTTADGDYSHAEGSFSKIISGCASHVEGKSNICYSRYSHIEGYKNTCGEYGEDEKYYGYISHVEGEGNSVRGSYSHIEGSKNNIYDSDYCHMEGINNNLDDGCWCTHVEGESNDFYTAKYCHIEGRNNSVDHLNGPTHIEGYRHSLSNGGYCNALGTHIQGRNADLDSLMTYYNGEYHIDYADIIGGDGKNISLLDWDGNQTIAGELYIKNSSQPLIRCLTQSEYNSLATKNPYTLYLIKEA